MKHSNLFLVCGAVGVLFSLNSAARAQTPVVQSADTQLWTETSFSTTLDKEKKPR